VRLLDAMLVDARAGTSGVLVLHGAPGLGKSALLSHAISCAAPVPVLRATGVESESGLPFSGLHQLLRPVIDKLDRLPSGQTDAVRGALGLAEPARDRFLLRVGVLSLLGEAAEPEGLLCVVDDAQWLDGESADALLFTARRLQSEGIVMLFAARDTGDRTFSAPGLPCLELTGLYAEAAARLLAAGAGPPLAPAAAAALVTLTGGKPPGPDRASGRSDRASTHRARASARPAACQ
jgi:AAA ATPase domain